MTLLTLAACHKEEPFRGGNENNPEDIIIPAGNYISFYADTNTRATLVTDNYITQPFGVYGYQYDFNSSWNGQRAVATPDVFWNTNNGTKVPLKVWYDGSIYNYRADGSIDGVEENGQVAWNSNRYAFFAYYPYENYNSNYFTTSSIEAEGAPYVTYKVNRSTTKTMYDVMTGGVKQITAASINNTVSFTMYHRLAAVDVLISNVYLHEYQSGDVNMTEEVDIVITGLQLQFDNLKYDTAKIFLEQDKNIPVLNTQLTEASSKSATYQLVGSSNPDIGATATVPPTVNEKTNLTAYKKTEEAATMTFIPQENSDLKVKAVMQYHMIGKQTGEQIEKLRVNEEGEPIDINGQKTDDPNAFIYDKVFETTKETSFNQPLLEGIRYYIVLNFTSEAVSINIITAEAWDESEIKYEFT